MSLWLRDQIRIVLCPERLTAVRLRSGFRPRVIAREIVPAITASETASSDAIASEPTISVTEASDITASNTKISDATSSDKGTPVLDALSVLLKKPAWQNGNVVVILSNHFMRYHLLPASSTRLTEKEQLARARHVLAQIYGERSATLRLRLDRTHLGSAVLVAGVESALIDPLGTMIDTSASTLISIQPCLMSLFNGYRQRISAEPQWFVIQEAGMLCAGLLHRRRWEQVRMQKTQQQWQPALERLLNRERVTSAVAEKAKQINLWTHDGDAPQLALSDGWSLTPLKPSTVAGFAPLRDSAFGAALAGVG